MSQSLAIADLKRTLRGTARQARADAHAARPDAGHLLAAQAMASLGARMPGTVAGYCPHETEIDCMPLLVLLERAGWQLALPVVTGRDEPLAFHCWQTGGALETGAWGIRVPPTGNGAVTPGLLLVPLLAFDDEGYRLGYGGGFYDRTLERLRSDGPVTAVGIAFAAQRVEACPRQDFDQPLDAVLTETGAMGRNSPMGQV